MKKAVILFLIFISIPILAVAQSVNNVDFISPIHNDVAAIQKDGKWAFINKEGQQIINFRTDLVTTNTEDGDYPMFNNDRCPIVAVKAGISYFGFIDKSGKTIIEPRFLNSTDFADGIAIALELDKRVIAKNTALGKDMVNYKYFEVLIDTNGKITYYLNQDGVNIVLDKDFLRTVPQITSKQISEDLYAVKNKKNLWNIIKIKE
ncbi:WG repeat-containing protein [Winogradskyella thalassocola]|uniref:WG containing repeat-containing protein n=1 Tax=Winogradskyella thalassocola TaxID=262004 RepID=A0A1G8JEK8_9FLAO|nr:WG repeat-containing protein [Winogradskyella thalassocola]SDI29724.1 WG containing repeat-containing protein [Winogradskyella thalassocola]